jgi:hypothetical protein
MTRLALAMLLLALPIAAFAAPSPGPSVSPAERVRDGGTIAGRLVAVDYQTSIIVVDAGPRGRLVVLVRPSTSIQAKDSAYHSFSDLKPGQRLEIFSSVADGKYVAQIILIVS